MKNNRVDNFKIVTIQQRDGKLLIKSNITIIGVLIILMIKIYNI